MYVYIVFTKDTSFIGIDSIVCICKTKKQAMKYMKDCRYLVKYNVRNQENTYRNLILLG